MAPGRPMYYLTWSDFDAAVMRMAVALRGVEIDGVYGIPRGGLPLAVALSHRLGIPLVNRVVWSRTLVVDDVMETGNSMLHITPAQYPSELKWVWVAKCEQPVNHVRKFDPAAWVVFPWEVRDFAAEDAANHYAARK